MTLDEINFEIQKYVSTHGLELSEELLKLLADLDYCVRYGEDD